MTLDEEKHEASKKSAASDDMIAATAVAEHTLPAQDGGKQAWLFLVGAAAIEIVVWGEFFRWLFSTAAVNNNIPGFPYCYGVFREYFFNHGPFKGVEYVSVAGVAANVGFLEPNGHC